MRKEGDFLHNTSKDLNTGILITPRNQQQKFKNTANDYVCCKTYKGFFSKRTLRIHRRKCGKSNKNDRSSLIDGRRLTQYVHSAANNVLKTDIIPVLRDDKITQAIKYDDLIIKYGNKLSDKYTLSHHHDMIRAHLRYLGRFKIEMMALDDGITEFKDILRPQLYDKCIMAIKKVASWDDSLRWYKHPLVAITVTSLIKKCGKKQRTEYIKTQSEDKKKKMWMIFYYYGMRMFPLQLIRRLSKTKQIKNE